MQNSQPMNNCMFNLLYTQFNEDFNRDRYFSYDIQYPVFYNLANSYFFVSPQILSNINSTIKSDAYTFKNGLLDESEEFNKSAEQNNTPKKSYRVVSNYAVTFNKNHVLSTIQNLMAFTEGNGPLYNELNNYNIDLLTGKTLTLKDIFNENINYTKAIADYVRYKIGQNKDLYYSSVDITIPEDQAFYITDDGLVIYFGLDQVAPAEFGIPKFKMTFNKFASYINPRFYCSPTNIAQGQITPRNRKYR